jgi:rubrerythrin
MAADKSPELGGALAEMTTKGDNAQAKEMYERLLAEQKSSSSEARETQQDMTRTMQEMFNKALESQSQVAQAFAQGSGQQAPQAQPGASGQPAADSGASRVVVCRKCMAESAAGTRFCPNCGTTLMNES